MAVKLSPLFNDQQETSAGVPAVGSLLYTYAAGSSTPQTTYTSSTGGVPQTNPIVFDSLGFPDGGEIWLTSGLSYKFVWKTAAGVTLRTIDNVSGVNDTSTTTDQWVSGATPTYISASSFSLVGDQTSTYTVGRRLKCTVTAGTVYCTIVSSAYTSLTTVKVQFENASVLDSGLSAISYGIITPDNDSLPRILKHGQCILAKSGANLVLSPRNGNGLMINGVSYVIPSAGVSLAPTGLSATTLYYIYAYMNSGVMTLEASTTTHAADSTTGVEIKSGDATRTLVGMAYVKTAATFADTVTQRFVRSWFNDFGITASNGFSADRTSAVTAGFAVIDAEIKTEFVLWAGEAASIKASGGLSNSGANTNRSGVSVDSDTVAEQGASAVTIPSGTAAGAAIVRDKVGLAEGYHYAHLLGYVNAGTGTWTGNNPLGWVLGVTVGGRR